MNYSEFWNYLYTRRGWVAQPYARECANNYGIYYKFLNFTQFAVRKTWGFGIGFMWRGAALYAECFLEVVSETGDDDGF